MQPFNLKKVKTITEYKSDNFMFRKEIEGDNCDITVYKNDGFEKIADIKLTNKSEVLEIIEALKEIINSKK